MYIYAIIFLAFFTGAIFAISSGKKTSWKELFFELKIPALIAIIFSLLITGYINIADIDDGISLISVTLPFVVIAMGFIVFSFIGTIFVTTIKMLFKQAK